MSDSRTVVLNGSELAVGDIVAIGVGDKRVALDAAAVRRCAESRDFIEKEVAARRIIYGVNTSFGPMCNKIIGDGEIEALQVNLIRSHAAGLGDPIPPYIALAVLAVRLNSLLKGYSGVRLQVLELMRDLINAGIAPYIPESGSVGASGDLVHLAHMALALIGEGRVYCRRELCEASDAFARAGLTPLRPSYKEGLALINGTAAMTALAAFAVFGARKALRVACVTSAFAMELFGGIDDAFDADLHETKPHPGQRAVADAVRRLYDGSGNITRRADMHERIRRQQTGTRPVYETDINVQDVYSIRCTPQIMAPVLEAVEYAVRVIETEANSCNDNPVIVPHRHKVIHGGNFHGQSIAFAMDMLAVAVTTLCNLSERRINKLLDKKLNEGLPEHLIPGTVGLTMGFMGAQYLATSSTAESRCLANPASVHSISCNASNQDVVSMGTVAARKAFRVIRNVKHVLTLEVLCDLQALTFRSADQLGAGSRKVYETLTPHFQRYDNERVMHDDLVKFRRLLFSSQLFDSLAPYAGADLELGR
jgi:histidine ammonia-lyase